MKTRPIKELLQILLENIDDLKYGLCFLCLNLLIKNKISPDEEWDLKMFIYKNRPWNAMYPHYWEVGKKAPRKAWLKKQINKL